MGAYKAFLMDCADAATDVPESTTIREYAACLVAVLMEYGHSADDIYDLVADVACQTHSIDDIVVL